MRLHLPLMHALPAAAVAMLMLLVSAGTAGAAETVPGLDRLRADLALSPLADSPTLASELAAASPKLDREIPHLNAINGAFTTETFRTYNGVLELGTVMQAFGVEEPPVPAPPADEVVAPEPGADPLPPQRSLRVVYLDPTIPLDRELRKRTAAAGVLLDPSATSFAAIRSAKGVLVVLVERSAYAAVTPIVWPRVIDSSTYNGVVATGIADPSSVSIRVNGAPISFEPSGTNALPLRPALRVGANQVVVNGAATNVLVTSRASADWKFTSRVSPSQRRVFRAIMRSSKEPIARSLVTALRPMTTVTIGDRKTDCTANGSSCAGLVNGVYTITFHPSHLTRGGDGPMMAWHEFGHLVDFSSADSARLHAATKRGVGCVRSTANLVLPPGAPVPCLTMTEAFPDSFAFWALRRDRATAGYLHKRRISHARMRSMVRPICVHLPT